VGTSSLVMSMKSSSPYSPNYGIAEAPDHWLGVSQAHGSGKHVAYSARIDESAIIPVQFS
jgi:hypothetical protein